MSNQRDYYEEGSTPINDMSSSEIKDSAQQSAHVHNIGTLLSQALPYIQHFHGKYMVIKLSGKLMANDCLSLLARDCVLLKLVGIHPIVVHGGGYQIGSMLERLGMQTHYINGLRVTDADTMDIVEMVLGGKINKSIVAAINCCGGQAIGMTGKDANLITAQRIAGPNMTDESHTIDLGHVGDVTAINQSLLQRMILDDIIPVIAPIGVDTEGSTLNINADAVATAIACELNAIKLIFLSDVPGVHNADGEFLSSLTGQHAQQMLQDGSIVGGMVPKVQYAVQANAAGVETHIINGLTPHAVLLELFTVNGIGSKIAK